jgi:hypothetical protein
MKLSFIVAEKPLAYARVRSRREVAQMLEELREAYQSLAPEKRRAVKNQISDSLGSQPQFESECLPMVTFGSLRRING